MVVNSRFIASIPMNLFVYPMIALWTLVGVISFPFAFALWRIFFYSDNSRIMRVFVWLYGRGWMVIMSPFVRFTREGFDKGAIAPPYVMVINHLSFFDFYCMALLPFTNVAVAVRSWPFRMPWYAPFMRLAGYLDVESSGWEGTLTNGRSTIAKGGTVLFFPEGHRSRDGKLQRFFSGPFKLAVETGTHILPLCMTGTDVLLPPGRWWMMPARIHLAALPSIDPKAFDGPFAHVKLRRAAKSAMALKIASMRGA